MGSEISHKIDQYVVRSQRNQQNILSVELKNASALLKQVTRSHDILEMIPHLTTAWNDHCQAKILLPAVCMNASKNLITCGST